MVGAREQEAVRRGRPARVNARRLLCVGLGHRWRSRRDAAGVTTTCRRCGALRHTREETVRHGEFKAHPNLAVTWQRLPAHGADELAEDEEQA
jgi:hypothetical protein